MRKLISQVLIGVLISTMGTGAIAAKNDAGDFVTTDQLIGALAKPVKGNETGPGRGASHQPFQMHSAEKFPDNRTGASSSSSDNLAKDDESLRSIHIMFTRGSAEIMPQSHRQLDAVARALQSDQLKDEKILIVGHTDSSGTAELNMELSKSRAIAVRDYLVQNGNIPADHLQIDGKGQTMPANPDDPLGPENRRVVFSNISE